MLGGFLALLAAAFFGFNNAATRRGVLTGTALQGMSISVPMGLPLFFIAATAAGATAEIFRFPTTAVLLLVTAGIAHFIWGRFCNYLALQSMGGNLVGPVQQTSLLISLILAIHFLGEVLTPLRIIGIILIFAGPLVMLRSRKARAQTKSAVCDETDTHQFKPNYVRGFTFAALSALGYGSSAVLIREAVIDVSFGASLAGGVIAYGAATVVLAPVLIYPRFIAEVRSISLTTAKWFTLSGFVVCVSQILRFMSLTIAPVTVVAPIQQTTTKWRVIFGWILNKDYEDFSFWVLTGIGVSLLGALTLTLSVEFVITHMPLPDMLISIARWQWP